MVLNIIGVLMWLVSCFFLFVLRLSLRIECEFMCLYIARMCVCVCVLVG